MSKLKFSLLILGSLFLSKENVHAHSHHHDTYIVEQAQAPIVVVQQAPQPMVVVQQVQTPAANAFSFDSPPNDLVEHMTASPGDGYVWQKGHWQWNGSWVWHGGKWAERPIGYSIYVPGYWKLSTHHHRWEWVEPYWK